MTWLLPTDICVVTGGSNGLGREILREFARHGCQTVSLDIDGADPDEIESQIQDDEAAKKTAPNNTGPLEGYISTRKNESFGVDAVNKINKNVAALSDAVDIDSEKSVSVTDVPPSIKYEFDELHQTNKGRISRIPSDTTPTIASESNEDTAFVKNVSTDDMLTQISEAELENLDITLSIRCDVRNEADLARAQDLILKKFGRSPSVIVLNAAKRPPWSSIAESKFEDMQNTIDVNLNGALKTLRTFLPGTIAQKRGFFVTIASALGVVVPKGLGPYGASKAALIGISEGLFQELVQYPDIHSLLVCCGQLDSPMFADVDTPSELLAPVVSAIQLAAKIVKRVCKSKTSTIYSPQYVRYLPIIHALPVSFSRFLRRVSGVDSAYDKAKAKEEQARQEAEATVNENNVVSVVRREITYADLMLPTSLTAGAMSREQVASSSLDASLGSASSSISYPITCQNNNSEPSMLSNNSISSMESCDQIATKPLVSKTVSLTAETTSTE